MKKIILITLSFLLVTYFFFSTSSAKQATTFTKFRLTTSGEQQSGPRIWGKRVVWTDWRGPAGLDIWMYDFETDTESILMTKQMHQVAYGLWQNKVIYRDESTTPASMRVYDIEKETDLEVTGASDVRGGAIYGDNAVYFKDVGSDGFGDLYVYNTKKDTTKFIDNNVANPVIWGNTVVWSFNLGGGYYRIKGYNIESSEYFYIPAESTRTQGKPDIYKNIVVWHDSGGGTYQINEKNLKTGEERVVYESSTSAVSNPTVSERYVAWVDDRGTGAHDIFVENRKTGEIVEVSGDGPQQPSPTIPDIYKNTVVWKSWHTGNGDIYGATLKH